jgi:hypothetical protein
MIIKNVRVVRRGDSTSLTATCKLRHIGWDEVDFTVEGENGRYLFEDASPFAAALLIPSMKLGEDLIIHGPISKALYEGMHEVMKEVLTWNVGLKPIKIKADKLVADTHRPTKTATFFSGGVDSFYTYLKHRTDANPADRVDSFLLAKGWDIDPRNARLWQDTYDNIKEIADTEGIELIVFESNLHALLKPIILWDYSHGGCLAGAALALRAAYRKVYIPSTFSVAEQVPWGSHMRVDPHFSTERLTLEHDGTEATRLEKILWQVAGSPLALAHLRICYMNDPSGAYNCGRCDKCLRTMISLYIAGALDKCATLPHEINLDLVAAAPVDRGKDKKIFHAENQHIDLLRQKKLNPELLAAIEANVATTKQRQHQFKGALTKRYIALENSVIYLDFAYTHGSVYKALASVAGRRF